jgi:hypothetical protein
MDNSDGRHTARVVSVGNVMGIGVEARYLCKPAIYSKRYFHVILLSNVLRKTSMSLVYHSSTTARCITVLALLVAVDLLGISVLSGDMLDQGRMGVKHLVDSVYGATHCIYRYRTYGEPTIKNQPLSVD